MDCKSQMADFASAFLPRDEITATDFEHTKSVATAGSTNSANATKGLFLKVDQRSGIAAKLDRAGWVRGT